MEPAESKPAAKRRIPKKAVESEKRVPTDIESELTLLRQQGFVFPKKAQKWLERWKSGKSLAEALFKLNLDQKGTLKEPDDYWRLLEAQNKLQRLTYAKDPSIVKIVKESLEKFKPLIREQEAKDEVRRDLIFQKAFLKLRKKSRSKRVDIRPVYLVLDFIEYANFEGGTLEDLMNSSDIEWSLEGLYGTPAFRKGLFYDPRKENREITVFVDSWGEDEVKFFSPYSTDDLIDIVNERVGQLEDLLQEGDILHWGKKPFENNFFVSWDEGAIKLTPLVSGSYFPPEAEPFLRQLKPRTGEDLNFYPIWISGFVLVDNQKKTRYQLKPDLETERGDEETPAPEVDLGNWTALVIKQKPLKVKSSKIE
jgi:hypothetical protein